MKAAILPDRGVVSVAGDEARTFLNGLLTADMAEVSPGRARYAALLTPQGKIIADCIVTEREGTLLLDCARDMAGPLAARLTFYKLRARIAIEDISDRLAVIALWNGANGKPPEGAFADPRVAALGWRIVVPAQAASSFAADHGLEAADAANYHAHRIALGVPEGGKDYALGDTFPHEADLDLLNGISFTKGCFIGQEVVSRMKHRGSVRKRVVPVEGEAPLRSGAAIMAGNAEIGSIGSVAGARALALVRLDRAAEAGAKAQPLLADGIAVMLRKPTWADFEVAPTPAAAGTP
jgi:folate-binding protein YgfZ